MYACIDVGTSSCKLAIYDEELRRKHEESVSLPLAQDGTQEPITVLDCVTKFIRKAKEENAKSVGIACYRSSFVSWDREGRPLSKIITWLSPATKERYLRLPGFVKFMRNFGPLDLVISQNSPALRFLVARDSAAGKEEAYVWTLDSFLAYNLTKKFVSDATNSTLTGLVNPSNFKKIGVILTLLGIRQEVPEIVDNTQGIGSYEGIEINAMIADQQAACIGEAAISSRVCKVTNGTGTFVDIPVREYTRIPGLIPIVIVRDKGKTVYGVEGYLPTTGSALQLLFRLGIVKSYSDLEEVSASNVIFIPSLAGLQIPNSPDARGLIKGVELSTDRYSIKEALLKSIAFHVRMVIEKAKQRVEVIRADGKLSLSNRLLSLISSSTSLPVERHRDVEATQRGLALLQIIAAGKMRLEELESTRKEVDVIKRDSWHGLEEEYSIWKETLESLKS
jgi:glycerol kinase